MSKLGTLRAVAAFELARGVILPGGLGALSLIHQAAGTLPIRVCACTPPWR
jgi:hypothetical protein